MAKYNETSGYIIHTRAFKDSSLIIEFFSQDVGMIHVLAKGIKKNKQLKTQLQYFNLLSIQYFGKSNLKTLCNINNLENFQIENLVDKMAGMYLNELIHLSLLEGEQAKPLFKSYQYGLQNLGKMKLSTLLRRFEFQLLKQNGLELSTNQFHNQEQWLTIDESLGLVITNQNSLKLCLVSELSDFIEEKKLNKVQSHNINKLMYAAINMSLSYKKVYSREMLKSLLSK